jgi:hypothetical protein
MSWCRWICRPWPQHYPHMIDEATANLAIQTINYQHHQCTDRRCVGVDAISAATFVSQSIAPGAV